MPDLLLCFYTQLFSGTNNLFLKQLNRSYKSKILTFKLEHYSPIDNYRGLNTVCEEVVGRGEGVDKDYFGWLGLGGDFL